MTTEFCDIYTDLEAVARRQPDAMAIDAPGVALTYAQLLDEVACLAGALRAAGVGAESLVALLHGRGVAMVTAMLAVQWAGGAFVPLDPDSPDDRLAWMLSDSGAAVAMTNDQTARRLETLSPGIRAITAPADAPTPRCANAADQLAYAIYTSGTTGHSKAALLTHGSLHNLAVAQREAFAIDSTARVLQFAAPTFDAFVSEVFVTLSAGATLCLADLHDLVTPEGLLNTLQKRQITDVTLPPSILASLPDEALPELRTLVVAGERCPATLAKRWASRCRLINAYGPTETTVCATMHLCDAACDEAPPIGRAIANVQVMVLGDDQQPVNIGESGELYIGGQGVARGYLNRPQLTAERFVTLPHLDTSGGNSGGSSGGRWFRSGDMVREDRAGHLIFLGRLDRQVKIRGVRIELDEVARVIERSPQVRQAEVWVEGQQLWAAVVPTQLDDREGVHANVQRFVRQQLPMSMLPSQLAVVDQFPLTAHGKVDHAALRDQMPAPTKATSPDAVDHSLEQMLQLWADVLPGRTPNADDDFFNLGGDSLAALDLLARVEKQWPVELSVAAFIEQPTPLGMVQRLRQGVTDQSALVRLKQGGDGAPIFCIHPAGGNVLCYRRLAQLLEGDRSVYGIQAAGMDGRASQQRSLEAIAAAYLTDVDLIEPHRPVDLVGWSFGGIVAYEMARQLEAAGREVNSVILLDAAILYSFAVLRRLFPFDDVRLYNFRSTPLEDIFPHFNKIARHADIVAADADDGLVRHVLEAVIANVNAVVDYRPQPYGGAIHLVMGATPYVKVKMRRSAASEWRSLAAEVIEHQTPGDHMTMLEPPQVDHLAKLISQIVRQPSGAS